ncbi:hypothetical protein J3F84DRAFT_300321 [Trichoderma pleuroticola]
MQAANISTKNTTCTNEYCITTICATCRQRIRTHRTSHSGGRFAFILPSTEDVGQKFVKLEGSFAFCGPLNLGFPPSGPPLSCGQSFKRILMSFADSFANQGGQGSENGCNIRCPITYHSCKEQIMQRAFFTIQARNTSTFDCGPLTIPMLHLLSGIASQYKRQVRSSKHRVVHVSLNSSQGVENCRHKLRNMSPLSLIQLPMELGFCLPWVT